jgi:hypothetical protein
MPVHLRDIDAATDGAALTDSRWTALADAMIRAVRRQCPAWLSDHARLSEQTGNISGDFVVEIPDGKSCMGIKATIGCGGGARNGTAGNDVIVGSAGADTISALAGNDVVCGLGGNGDDQLFGDSGSGDQC